MDVSLEKGVANVKMQSGNTASLRQLQEAITKNGFTMKPSILVIAGKIALVDGQPKLRVSGSNDVVSLAPDSKDAPALTPLDGKSVVVEGTLNEASKGKAPDSVRYRSITEENK